MTRFLVFLIATALWNTASAQDALTAKQALKSVEPSLPPGFADRIIEVTGANGTTQPRVWRFVSSDSTVPGGIRVAEIRDGKLAKLDSPSSRYTGSSIPVIDFRATSTDSLRAFQAANLEASRAGVGFDSVDYALRIDAFTKRPTWVLTLLDVSRRPVGTVFVSASTGKITRAENLHKAAPASVVVNAQPVPIVDAQPHSPSTDAQRSEGFFDTMEDGFDRTKYFFKKGAKTAGGSVQEFFTGRRTIDQEYRQAPTINQ